MSNLPPSTITQVPWQQNSADAATPSSTSIGRSNNDSNNLMRSLSQILQELNEPLPTLFLSGDGSGQGWKTSAGYACLAIDCHTGERVAHYGGLSLGSVNMAELLPYIQAMSCFHEAGRGKTVLAAHGHCRVVILTDSGYVAMCGAVAADVEQLLPGTHSALWACIRQWARMGYVFRFHHRPRSTTLMNQWADLTASLARKSVVRAIADNMDAVGVQAVGNLDIRQINP